MQTDTKTVDAHLWKKVLMTVETRIGPHKFNLWLRRSVLTACEESDGSLLCRVGLPNLFIEEWVTSNYKDEVEEALSRAARRKARVTFCVDQGLFTRSREERQRSEEALRKSERAKKSRQSGLRKSHTFSSFVVHPSNHLAFQATKEAVRQPGRVYNPLFIHGAPGLGKTHLMQGALKAARAQHPNIRATYVSCDQFVNQFVLSMKSGTLSAFRERFRKLDLLIIDDIQILSKKDATQSEFLYTLNELDTTGSQIIIAGDTHPKRLKNLGRKLVDRFVCGMVVRVEAPNLEGRVKILQSKAAAVGKKLQPGVIDRIARRVTKNVRELEAALTKVIAFEAVSGTRLTDRLVPEVLGDGFEPHPKGVTLKDIETQICSDFRVTAAALKERGRKKAIVLPRQIAISLSRELTGHSLAQIGRYWGGRNHTTVMFACRRVAALAKEDGQIRRVLQNLRAAILSES